MDIDINISTGLGVFVIVMMLFWVPSALYRDRIVRARELLDDKRVSAYMRRKFDNVAEAARRQAILKYWRYVGLGTLALLALSVVYTLFVAPAALVLVLLVYLLVAVYVGIPAIMLTFVVAGNVASSWQMRRLNIMLRKSLEKNPSVASLSDAEKKTRVHLGVMFPIAGSLLVALLWLLLHCVVTVAVTEWAQRGI